MADSVQPEPIKITTMIIIKYNEWLRIQPDIRNVVYELCDDNFKAKKELDKEDAIKMIKENHLQMVHKNKYGAIWR